MNNKRYKDLIATGILLGIIILMVSVGLFAKYGSHETKEMVAKIIVMCLFLFLIFAVWKAIRLIID